MITCTFYLKNRLISVEANTPKDCWEQFIKKYPKQEKEIRQIDVISPIEKVSIDTTVFKNTWIND